jgi:hypothetical protein
MAYPCLGDSARLARMKNSGWLSGAPLCLDVVLMLETTPDQT